MTELTEERKLWQQLWLWLKPDRVLLLLLLFVIIVNTLIAVSGPIFLQIGLDGIKNKDTLTNVLFFTALFAVARIIIFFTQMIENIIVAKVNSRFIHRLRVDSYSKIINNNVSFFDNSEMGRIVSRITNDSNELMSSAQRFVNAFSQLIILFGVLAVMLSYNIALTIGASAITPILLFAIISMRKFQRRVAKRWRRSISQVNANFGEVMASIPVSKAFGREKENYSIFHELNEETYRAAKVRGLAVFAVAPIQDFLKHVGIIILLLVANTQLVFGVSVSLIYLFVLLQGYMYEPVGVIARSYNQFQSSFAAMERILEIMADDKTSEDIGGILKADNIKGKIEFRNVTFAYTNEVQVLKNLSFIINPGETRAIVGHTGSGKTTITALIMRFYTGFRGKILIDGVPIQDYNLYSLRKNIGYVSQNVLLFSGTIADNLRIAKTDASDEEIWRALDIVQGREFIEALPDGIYTMIREEGANLSMGQRQMISLSRAILSDPKILILDEFSSSLDLYTEAKIQQGIQALLKNRTSIIIAHRLTTILQSDRILVLSNGELIEEGTHDELLKKGGSYHKIFDKYFSFQLAGLVPRVKKNN